MQKKSNKYFKKSLLDPKFDCEKEYFYKELPETDWAEIAKYAESFLTNTAKEDMKTFLNKYPFIYRAPKNIERLRQVFNEAQKKNGQAEKYQEAVNYIIDRYYITKPYICNTIFFPGEQNEHKVVNMIRTAHYTLDVCMFTMTNDKLFEAIEEVWNANVMVRVITDDECVNNKGSDVNKLACLGVPIKVDSNAQYHMHHKFVIIDGKVIITGSFNWTVQAVKNNNENVLLLENEKVVKDYMNEFEKLWNTFTIEIKGE